MHAARYANVSCLQALLEAGSDPNARAVKSTTSLMAAVTVGSANVHRVLDALHELGIEDVFPNRRQFSLGADVSREKCVRVLIDANVKIDAKDSDGVTALMMAYRSGYSRCANELLRGGADVNVVDKRGCTALMHAVRRGCIEGIRPLLDAGADVHVTDNRGSTALNSARQRSYQGIVDMLTVAGATE